jgi:ATP-dependent RNA helicase DDX49/DBP8
MGCAETGSGKTAAFALPILQHLSEDAYGIFAVIVVPTRELAMQIKEQVAALGAPIGVRVCLVIGGLGIIDQGIELSKRPHVVCATPGRLRHHLESADPPDLSRTKYLVLDEADRLLSTGFSSELKVLLSRMSPSRKTLIFSATLTDSLEQLEKLASVSTMKYDLTKKQTIPERLVQNYLLMPPHVKMCFLVGVLKKLVSDGEDVEDEDATKKKDYKKKNRKRTGKEPHGVKLSMSVIIFVGTCQKCQMTQEALNQLGIDCVALHSIMSQQRRIAALGKFRNQVSQILVATDVASRGLDIPSVELVINFDLPKVAADFVHRIGRTARAGRSGRSLSFLTPHDIDLLHNIEDFTKIKMVESKEVKDDEILTLLNPVSKAMHKAEQRLMEVGFEEQAEKHAKRKKVQRKKLQKKTKQES